MMRFAALTPILICTALLASLAQAEGFAVDDLRTVPVDASILTNGTFVAEATAPNRITFACLDCGTFAGIDVRIGRQDDGTEERMRAGLTTIDDIRAMCQANDPSCQLDGITSGRAIGWITTYDGSVTGSTALLFLDGDLLTIRSIADDVATARANGDAVRAALAPAIIGAN